MKRIIEFWFACLMIGLVVAGPVGGTIIDWDNGGADYKWSTAANWVGDTKPGIGDTVLLSGTVDDSIHIDENTAALGALIIPATYSGGINMIGVIVTCGKLVNNGAGKRAYNTGSVWSITNDSLIYNDATAAVSAIVNVYMPAKSTLVSNRNVIWDSLFAASTGPFRFQCPANVTFGFKAIKFGGDSVITTSTGYLHVRPDVVGRGFIIGTSRFYGTTGIIYAPTGAGTHAIPKILGVGAFNFDPYTAGVVDSFTDTISVGALSISGKSTSGTTAHKLPPYLVCTGLTTGQNAAGGKSLIYDGSGNKNVTGNIATYTAGICTTFSQTSITNVTGNVILGDSMRLVPGTSTIKFINTSGTQVVKMASPANQLCYDIEHTGAAAWVDSTVGGLRFTDYTGSGNGNRSFLAGLTSSGDVLLDGTGTQTIVGAVTMNSPTGNWHLGSTTGVPTTEACSLAMNTGTLGVIDMDRSVATIKAITVGVNDTVNLTGAGALTVTNAGPPLTLNNGASLNISAGGTTKFYKTTAGDMFVAGTGSRIIGNSQIDFQPIYAGAIVVNIPALTSTSTGQLTFFEGNVATIPTYNWTGNTAHAGIYRLFVNAATTGTYNTNGFDISGTTFNIGSNNASGACNINLGAGTTITLTAGVNSALYNSGTTTVNDTANWSVSTNFNWRSTHTHNAAAGNVFNYTGTGAIASTGMYRPDSIYVTGIRTASDRLRFGALTVGTGGTFAITDHSGADTIARGMAVTGTLNTDVDTVYVGGDITLATGSTISATTGKWLCGKDGVNLAINGKSIPLVQLIGTANFTSSAATGGTLAGLTMPAAGGDTVKWQHSKRWTISAKPTLRGTARNYWLSSAAGSRDTIDLPAKDTLHNFYIKGQYFMDTVTCKRADTCLSGGYNN